MPHSPMDLYAQFRFIDPSIYGSSFSRFRNRYAIMGGYDRRNVVGYKNMSDLIGKFHANADVVKAEDVLDLVPTQDIDRVFKLSRKEHELYIRVKLSVIAQIESGEITMRNGLVKLLRLQQATSGMAKLDDGKLLRIGNTKSKEMLDIWLDIPMDEHIVVFCRFTADVEEVLRVAESVKRKCFELSGSRKQIEEWNDAGGVLAVQIDAGGEGVDLTASRYCIYYSLNFSYGKYLQSRKRLDRPGQKRSVIYWHLIAEKTIDADVYSALSKKQDAIEHVLYALRGSK